MDSTTAFCLDSLDGSVLVEYLESIDPSIPPEGYTDDDNTNDSDYWCNCP